MTLKEIKQNIAESPNKDFYQDYQIQVDFPHVNYSLTLKGVVNIYVYILKQIAEFEKYPVLPTELDQAKQMLTATRDNIIFLIEGQDVSIASWNNNLGNLTSKRKSIFLPDFSETDFLVKILQDKPDFYPGVIEYFRGSTQHAANSNYFSGYMLGYEFKSKDFSGIVERKEAEKKSILNSRLDFQNKLGEAQNEVVEYIAKSDEKFKEYVANVDELINSKKKEFNTWFENTSGGFKDFNEKSNQNIKTLEELYIEKLKLEAPAQYWNKRAIKLRKEGNWWLVGMIVCLAASVITLACILGMVADGTLQMIFSETSTAIKWSVTFITLISFLAYGLRTFAKLTFSSFHLVRDAEEREQLTYVYLALKKEKDIDQTERHLIMQSLFSRADSGLLRDDSGPTMPGNIIDQVTKK